MMMEGSNWEERMDIILQLSGKGMYHIIHQIFQHFDAKILRELESLSHAWKQMFVLGKIWKMRLMENVRLSKDWKEIVDVVRGSQPNLMKEENGYRKVYHLVAEKLMENLENNWKNGFATTKNFSFTPPTRGLVVRLRTIYDEYKTPADMCFGFNNKLVVVAGEGSTIIVRNRFKLNLVKVLNCPTLSSSMLHPEIYSIKISDNFIVASFVRNNEVCVWSAVTLNLLWVLDGDLIDSDPIERLVWSSSLHLICLYGNSLLTAHRRGPDMIFTMYNHISSDPNHAGSIIHDYQEKLVSTQCVVKEIFMDETNIVLVFDYGRNYFLVETRLVSSCGEIRSEIELMVADLPLCCHYFDGVFCARIERYLLMLWDVASGVCLRSVRAPLVNDNALYEDHYSIKMIKINLKTFLVISGSDGGDGLPGLMIWDLKAILDSSHNHSTANEHQRLKQTQILNGRDVSFNGLSVQADQYQIGIVTHDLQGYEGQSALFIWDFGGEWKSSII